MEQIRLLSGVKGHTEEIVSYSTELLANFEAGFPCERPRNVTPSSTIDFLFSCGEMYPLGTVEDYATLKWKLITDNITLLGYTLFHCSNHLRPYFNAQALELFIEILSKSCGSSMSASVLSRLCPLIPVESLEHIIRVLLHKLMDSFQTGLRCKSSMRKTLLKNTTLLIQEQLTWEDVVQAFIAVSLSVSLYLHHGRYLRRRYISVPFKKL